MMDLTCFNWIQLIKKTDLPSNAKLLAFYLSTFMNAEHDIAWPSQSRISSETGLTEPTVRKYLKFLDEKGWLVTRKKARVISSGSQNYHHNEYLINIPEQRVSSLLSDMSRGKIDTDQRVNSQRSEGKELTTNNNRITSNNNRRFIPPTVDQVKAYCQERNNDIDPDHFVDHYEANGWMRGKSKIKDWKACVRTWEKNNKKSEDNLGVYL